MTDPSPATASHSIRKRRKWPWVLASLGFLLVTLLVFAPTLLSTALVRERLLSALGSQLHGDLDVAELSVSWSGPQRLEGLRLRPTGSEDSSNDLLQLDSASIDQGLLGLAFGGDQVLVELRRLRLYVHRAADGRFNFAPLLEDPPGDRNPAPSAPKEPTSSPPRPEPPRLPESIQLPGLPRALQLRLTEAEIHYRDDLLETAATASDLTVQVDGSPTEVAVDIAATVSSPGAETTGQLNAQATVAGLGKSVPLPELLVDGKAQLQSLPLLPYRGLLDKWFAVVPPLRSLSATIVVSTADRKLRIDSDLDVGAVAAESLQVSLPLDMDTDELAELRGDVTLRLPENFHAPGLELPEGLELRGETEVRLQEIVARVNLRDIAAVPDNLEAHAKLTLQGNVLYQGFDTRSVQAELHCRHGKASIEKLVATVNEGRVSSNALMVNLKETPPAYRGDVKLEDIRGTYEMTPLLAYAVPFLSLDKEQADFHGRLHGNLEVSGRGFSQKDMARSLQGAGNVRVRDGSFTASKFFQGVVSLFGAKMDRLRFSELGSDFTLGSAKLVASKVFLRPREDGKMRNLGLVGVTGFDGSLDFSVNLAAIHASVGDKKIRGILEEAQKIFKSDTLPLRLGGTLDSPQLQFGAATGRQGQKATPSAFEKLLETAGAATKEIAGKGSEAKETPEAEAGGEDRTSGKQETKKEKTFGVESIFQILEDRKREKKERRRQRREKKKKQKEEGQATS